MGDNLFIAGSSFFFGVPGANPEVPPIYPKTLGRVHPLWKSATNVIIKRKLFISVDKETR
jgi:hypothetical protein